MRFARKCARRKRRFAPTLRLRNLQDVACALAHLDRGADPALRAFKNGSRHDVADRIFAPSKPQLFALRLEAEQQCAARCMLACGAGLFVPSVGKFQTGEHIACCGAERAFRSPYGSNRLTVSARFSIPVRLFRPARLRPIDPRSGVARVGSNAARTPPFPARCAFPIHCG